MKVRVKAYASFRDFMGSNIEVALREGADVDSLIRELERRFGSRVREELLDEDRRPRLYVKILLNGRDVEFLQGLKTRLKDGDVVALFPPVGGG
mgnify:CR=1 FL=1